jgi:hypothetical protein
VASLTCCGEQSSAWRRARYSAAETSGQGGSQAVFQARACRFPRSAAQDCDDQLRSYPAAKAEIPELIEVKHVLVKTSARDNNWAENSHELTRERERRMRGFRDHERTQAFVSSFGWIRQHFALKRHLLRASLYRKQLGERFAAWRRFTELSKIRLAFEEKSVCRTISSPTL